MKHNTFFIFFIFSYLCLAQHQVTHEQVKKLKEEITQSQNEEKLILLDSLSELVKNKHEFKYDSIAKATIDLAFELGENNLATKHSGDYLFYLANRTPRSKEAMLFFKEFIEHNWKVTDTIALAWVYSSGADGYFSSGLEEESIPWYEKAENLAIKAKDSAKYALIKGYKGYALSRIGKFALASQEYQKAIAIFNRRNDSLNILKVRIGLSILYGQNGFYKECEAEQEAIHKLSVSLHEYGATAINLGNRATNCYGQGDYKGSVYYNKEKLKLIEEHPQLKVMETSSLKTLVNSYVAMDSLDQARVYLKKLKAKFDLSDSDFNLKRQYTEALAQVYFLEKEYKKANALGKELLRFQQESANFEGIMGANEFLAEVNEALGNYHRAFDYFKAYVKINDSILSVQKTQALSYYQTLYETKKREATIANQESEIILLNTQNKFKNQCIIIGIIGLLSLFAIIYLIRTKQFVRRKQELQAGFSRNLIQSQEEERTRFARDLHDSLGQKLMLLAKKTKIFRNKEVDALALNTLEEVRSISRGLYPKSFEHMGVTAAITAMVNEVDANTNIFFTNEIENIDALLPKETSLHLYRIIQEALNNMVKHAGAKSASISIERKESNVEVVIKDNGKGFEFLEKLKKNTSLGMKTLLERTKIIESKLHITSVSNEGTTIELIIPI